MIVSKISSSLIFLNDSAAYVDFDCWHNGIIGVIIARTGGNALFGSVLIRIHIEHVAFAEHTPTRVFTGIAPTVTFLNP